MPKLLKTGIFLIALLSCFPAKSWADPIPVFASIIPQKYFLKRIGGDRVKVEVMVNPGASPATFNPNPKKMSLLSRAKLYFSIGVPFEKIWINRIQSIHPLLKIVPLHKLGREKPMTGQGPNDNHLHSFGDPHIWTSPARVKVMAIKIRDALVKVQPDHENFFNVNLEKFISDLNNLDLEIREILEDNPGRHFMVFHPAWSYFAVDYSLEQVSIEQEGKEPGAQALQKIIEQGKKLGIKVIFVQKQFSLSIPESIAKTMGAKLLELDPLAEDYIENMRQTAKAISGALK